MAQISLAGLSKRFDDRLVLDAIDLAIEKGEFLTFVGPSGCGKSTLLRIIAGLERQSAGSVAIDGRCVDDVRAADRDLAMVFQSYALYPHLSVADNIAVPLVMRRLSAAQRLPGIGRWLPGAAAVRAGIAAEVEQVAATLGLEALLARRPGQLSGGQRQRVALARALIRHPRAFLMDEPLSNLDANMRAQMRREIGDLHRRLGATIIYVTHDQAEAMTMSDRVVVLRDGRIQQVGRPRDIYERPANLAVARFFGEPAINLLPGQARADGRVEVAGRLLDMSIPMRPGAVTLGVRPHILRAGQDPADGGWQARLIEAEYLGEAVYLHVALGDLRLVARWQGGDIPAPGADIRLDMPSAGGHLFGADGARIAQEAGSADTDRRCAS